MALPKLVISRVDFDATKIADALKTTPDEAVTALQDGRGAWPFSEIWGEHGLTPAEFADQLKPARKVA